MSERLPPLVPAGVVVPLVLAGRAARVLARGLRVEEREDNVRDGELASLVEQLERAARVSRSVSPAEQVEEVPSLPRGKVCSDCGEPSSDGALRHGLCNRCRMRVRRAAEREARRPPWERMEAELEALERESDAARLAAEQSRMRWGL